MKDELERELYLRWLVHNEMFEDEEKPIGLILCSEKSPEQIKVADYITELPEKKIL